MRALVDHQKRCEREGKYDEAQATARRVAELKQAEEAKHKRNISDQHQGERSQAEAAYLAECEQHAEVCIALLPSPAVALQPALWVALHPDAC